MLECHHRQKINYKAGFSEYDEQQNHIFCYCEWRNCNISKWFCMKCRSPKIPCPKCGHNTLQSVSVDFPLRQYKCIDCNHLLSWSKIKYLKLLAKKYKRKLLSS